MKKIFKIKDLDCANCAAKMENAAAKVNGVSNVKINFMTQKITIEAEDANFDEIVNEVENVMKKVEKDVCIIK